MQLVLLTFADSDACAVEIFCNWPAALLLHWGIAEAPGSPWRRMELNKMLLYVESDFKQEGGGKGKQHKKKDSELTGNGTSTDEADNTLGEQHQATDSPGSEHLETLYGTFAHYPIDDKAAQTLFEVNVQHALYC